MTDKAKVARVTLPREVAEAIELARKWEYSDAEILKRAAEHGFVTHELIPLESVDIMTLAKALINGYEIEKSPAELEAERKEKVREYYNNLDVRFSDYNVKNNSEMMLRTIDRMHTVVDVLNLLEIKIPGVNDDA
jgi:hypothetical protein